MSANPWLIALHLIALFVWLGHMIMTPRVLAYAVAQPEEHQLNLLRWLRRSWNVMSPAGLVVLVIGLMMLHGVGMPGNDVGHTLGTYMSPRQTGGQPSWEGEPSYWYVTFHIKLVAALLLIFSDLWLGAQISRMLRQKPPKRTWAFATLMGLSSALLVMVPSWLILSEFGLGRTSRFIGMGLALLALVGSVFATRKLGRTDSRAKYMMFHGVVAGLMIIIVFMIIVRPLAYAGNTLG